MEETVEREKGISTSYSLMGGRTGRARVGLIRGHRRAVVGR